MFDPIELYIRMSKMNDDELVDFEQSMFNKFKDIESTYEFVIKSNKNNNTWKEKFNDVICALCIVRCYIVDRHIPVEHSNLSKFIFHVNLLVNEHKKD